MSSVSVMRRPSHDRRVLVLVGPTASGKTPVSLLLASRLEVEIISADSRQIYKLMDIGTAKPSRSERRKVKHHFVDRFFPDREFNAGEFGRLGRRAIERIFGNGKIPLVVGGSGLYVQSLIDGFFDGPPADPQLRAELMRRAGAEGPEKLLEELRKVDPASAAAMLPSNIRRIIRALEVFRLTGVPISMLKKEKLERNFTPVFAGLEWERADLYDRIDRRVDTMFADGLVDEVKRIEAAGFPAELNALQTVGYREVIDYLRGALSLESAIDLVKRNSRRYAKRQLTWFRRDDRIRWFHVGREEDFPQVAEEIHRHFLG